MHPTRVTSDTLVLYHGNEEPSRKREKSFFFLSQKEKAKRMCKIDVTICLEF